MRGSQGDLLASCPALGVTVLPNLVFVLHLPKRYGSPLPGLEYCCEIVSRRKGNV